MHSACKHFKYCLRILLLSLAVISCNHKKPKTLRAEKAASFRLPADCEAAIDTYITGTKMRKDPAGAIHTFNHLAAKYEGRDSLAYAQIRAYAAQAWDVLNNGDSMIAACEDALDYFDNPRLPYLDSRSMAHLYMGWGYYYKKNQLTANYFFSLAGNDITDTLFIPETHEYITSHYPPATKAALLEEIAAMARISGLTEQARNYIDLSRRNLELMPQPDPYLRVFIYLESGCIYSLLKQYDSAAYFLYTAAKDTVQMNNPSVRLTYLDHIADYYMDVKKYDSCIYVSLEYERMAMADTTLTDAGELASQRIVLAGAYTANGEYDKAAAVLKKVAPVMMDEHKVLEGSMVSFLEARAANALAGCAGPAGYRTMEEYVRAKNKLYDQQRLSTITDMDARYKTRRKEDAIRRLNVDNEAYERKTRFQSKVLTIFVLSFLLIIAVAVIIAQRQARRRLQESVDRMALEQRLLRSQIEPHFIFNTLAVLQGLIRREEKALSIRYLNQFAKLLRISLEHARESFVPLSGEIDALGHYLALQQLRFQNAFTYTIDTWEDYEEESSELLIPPMLLQPFAENAVHHGMKGNTEKEGRINIRLQKAQHVIHFIIEDNGPGYDTNAPQAPKGKKQSLAIVITRERLAILGKKTGHPASLTIISALGQGTRVEMLIPYALKT